MAAAPIATGFVPRTAGVADYTQTTTPTQSSPASYSAPAPYAQNSAGSLITRNPVTGTPNYSAVTTPASPVGTMNAVITQPNPNAPKTPAPVVLTADAAEKNLANIKAQVAQLTTDVANHKAAMSTPSTTTTPSTSSTDNNDGTGAGPQGTGSLDDQINSVLNNLTGNDAAIDTNETAALTPIQAQQAALQKESDAATVTALNQLNSIASGTYPLSASEQALLSSTQASYLATIQGQTTANTAFTGQMTELAASLGIETSSPAQAAGMIHAAISQGSDKVAELNGQMAQSLATLQQGFQKDDFDMVQSAWQDTAKYYDDRLTALKDMQSAVIDASKQQKSDLMDQTKLVLSTMMDSANYTQKQKEDAVDAAYKAGTLSENQRHDFATEAISKENADNNSTSGGGTFTKTQTNKGAANAGVDVATFASYPTGVKNYYINNPTQAKAFEQLVVDRQSGKTSSKDVADTISTANVPDDVKTWMYQAAGVDANGNPIDGKQDSALTAGLSEAGNFLGNSYDDVKSFLGIQ